MKLIVAQGNPGRHYQHTRHNVGFLVVDAMASDAAASWRRHAKANAETAELHYGDTKVLLVKPLSFYNDTGPVIRALVDFYKLTPATDVLVIHDDLALSLGTIRIRQKGSDAGNNGVKSLSLHLGDAYTRLRVGIASPERGQRSDADFVLGTFTQGERRQLDDSIIPRIIELATTFSTDQLESTSHTIDLS